jgi:hypothetical protein
MKKNLLLPAALFSFLAIISCSSSRNATDDFKQATANHQVVALLPIQLTYSGELPKEIKPDELKALQEQESGKIQEQLYFELLRNNHPRKKSSKLITYQSLQTTNSILQEKGISTEDIYKKDAREIASLLNVDAVLFTKVDRRILIADKTNIAINAGQRTVDWVLSAAGKNVRTPNLPAGRIYFSIALNEGEKGNTIWVVNDATEYGTKYTNEDVIRSFVQYAARKIPYRK